MKITEQNFVRELKRQNESALEYVMTHYGGLVKSVAHRFLPAGKKSFCQFDCRYYPVESVRL